MDTVPRAPPTQRQRRRRTACHRSPGRLRIGPWGAPARPEGPSHNLNPAHLHNLAKARWLASEPNDPQAARYAAAMEAILINEGQIPARPRVWIEALLGYEHWTAAEHRPPRENTRARETLSDHERHLGEWARYQRRFEERLNAYQRARLDLSPAFSWDIRASAWQQSFQACLAHRARTGELPRLNGADRQEFDLARWLGRQLRDLQLGRLEERRADRLRELLRRR